MDELLSKTEKRTYEEIIKEIQAEEKLIKAFTEEKNVKIKELKKEANFLWSDWQTEEHVRLKKYIGKLCFVSDTNAKNGADRKIGVLEKVVKTKSKEIPFHYLINGMMREYDFFMLITSENIKPFIYKE